MGQEVVEQLNLDEIFFSYKHVLFGLFLLLTCLFIVFFVFSICFGSLLQVSILDRKKQFLKTNVLVTGIILAQNQIRQATE